MDPSSSAGNSPLIDGDKNDSRLSNSDDDLSGKKNQQSSGGGNRSQPQNQQNAGRKGPPTNQGPGASAGGGGVGGPANSWRPTMQSNQTSQNSSGVGGGPGQSMNQGANVGQQGQGPGQGQSGATHRFAAKPRMGQPGPAMGGGSGLGMGQNQSQQGMPQGQGGNQSGAWPTATFYPRATRFPQPPPLNLNNNQNIPQGSMGMRHYPPQQQQQSNSMPLHNQQGGYGGGPRGMGLLPSGMQSGGGPGGPLMMSMDQQLSKTNLYIRGLQPNTSDRDLFNLCCVFGSINSTKAIIDKMTNQCKGYGFVDFENPQAADRGLKELTARGMQVQMAKVRNQQEQMQDSDPTNLYLANLSPFMVEQDLEAMLQPYGRVISTRVLRDGSLTSRGVGFARMESKDVCDKVIEVLNGKIVAGSQEALVVKFADSGNRRRQQNRERGGWNRMDQHPLSGYEQMAGGQNGLAGSMLTSIRYSVPQNAALAGYPQSWQPQYTILPQQMTQMMQGVEGPAAAYSMSQLAAQMTQLGLSSYNPSPYSQYGYNPQQMYQANMAQMGGPGGVGQGDDGQNSLVSLDGQGGVNVVHSGVNNMGVGGPNPPSMQAVYNSYSQTK